MSPPGTTLPSASDRPLPALAICYGTRPQIIKASALIEALRHRYHLLTVETGQHYDYPLNALLHDQLSVRAADRSLGAGDSPAGESIETVRRRAAGVLARDRPRAVIVIGDTNSTAGSAQAAIELGIPVVHVEAGLRLSGPPTAEERIRREVDRVSTLLCAPSATAVANLEAERVGGTIVLTGDIALDVLLANVRRPGPISAESGWPLPTGQPFVLATLHRAELVEVGTLLSTALGALGNLPLPVVLPVHPRLRAAFDRDGLIPGLDPRIHLIPPLGYLQALAAVRDAAVIVTDSGGLQREAYWLGTPCVTLRAETEWVETVAAGANILVAPERAGFELPAAVQAALTQPRQLLPPDRTAFGTGDAGERIAAAIAGVL